jgi:hypothetical protein
VIAASGFEFVSLERGFHASSPLTITAAPYIIGVARRAEAHAARIRTVDAAQINHDTPADPRGAPTVPAIEGRHSAPARVSLYRKRRARRLLEGP